MNTEKFPMERNDAFCPQSLSGEPLMGSKLVRQIYIDEAGTSSREPVTVVLALLVHADTQWKPLLAEYLEVRKSLPVEYGNQPLHAIEITDSKKYLDWKVEDRYALLSKILAIPRRIGLALSIGAFWRDKNRKNIPQGMTGAGVDHINAYCACVGKADEFIRENFPDEMVQLIVEKVSEREDFLKGATMYMRQQDVRLGWTMRNGVKQYETVNIRAISDQPLFANKADSPVLQIADTCAWAVRRYLSEPHMPGSKRYGRKYMCDMLGEEVVPPGDFRIYSGPPAPGDYWKQVLCPTDTGLLYPWERPEPTPAQASPSPPSS